MRNLIYLFGVILLLSCNSDDELKIEPLSTTKEEAESPPIKLKDIDFSTISPELRMEPILVESFDDIQRLFDDVPNIPVDINNCQMIDIDSIIQNTIRTRVEWNDITIRTVPPGIMGYAYDGKHRIKLKISSSLANAINAENPGAPHSIKSGKEYIISRCYTEVGFNIGVNDGWTKLPSPKCGFDPAAGIEIMTTRGYLNNTHPSYPTKVYLRTNYLFIHYQNTSSTTPILETSYPFNAGIYEWNVKIIHY